MSCACGGVLVRDSLRAEGEGLTVALPLPLPLPVASSGSAWVRVSSVLSACRGG